ncbi:MAG TPA: 4-(cytidine 5'-diphospho)-2-C-methyl-D-erythritol kinase [Chitinophagaceae bacterium]|nr:4-(cytidine 5'-diphospho)-2-C-methyl-D-erythritol kinase [Chitinophagaceae bacterium]
MVVFPNCKINLGLNILRKRSDGFHDLETIFHPLPFYDILEVIAPEKEPVNEFLFTTSGITIDGHAENNLCVKAYHLLKKDFPKLSHLRIHLHKTIPSGAGLGGGSADAAFTLKLFNDKFHLNLSAGQLTSYALQLGSDCPFFIINKTCFASGRGEILEPIHINLNRYKFVLINPGIPIHTAYAFSQITPAHPARPVNDIIKQPVNEWKEQLKNDFEEPVFKQYPEIKKIKDELYRAGAVYASLSGSGSTVYGLFEKEKKAELSFPSNYFVRESTG